MKASAIAPSNIAFIKYWGKKDEILRLPENGSISMCLDNMHTTTTVEFSSLLKNDKIIYNNEVEESAGKRVIRHLDRVRGLANVSSRAKVQTITNFPPGTGLSSSASGFAALTLAAVKALELNISEKEISILSRQGSGSACRSIPDGFVEWLDGDSNETSYAVSLYPSDYWQLFDIVVVVSTNIKDIPTTTGMSQARKSRFFESRLLGINTKIKLCKECLKQRDFVKLGELIESEALEMHAMMITQDPPLIYWTTGTLNLMKLVQKWRSEGIECYFTLNTGQNIHIITLEKYVDKIKNRLMELDFVIKLFVNKPGKGAATTSNHLF